MKNSSKFWLVVLLIGLVIVGIISTLLFKVMLIILISAYFGICLVDIIGLDWCYPTILPLKTNFIYWLQQFNKYLNKL